MQRENGKSSLCKHSMMPGMVLISLQQSIVVWKSFFNSGLFPGPISVSCSLPMQRLGHFIFCLQFSVNLSVNTVDAACQQWKKTNASVNEMSSKHVVDMDELIRLVD